MNWVIDPMCLRPLLSKSLREVYDIVSMGQCESDCLFLRLGRSKGEIVMMCLRQLRSKALK